MPKPARKGIDRHGEPVKRKAISLLREVFCYPEQSRLLDSDARKEVAFFLKEAFGRQITTRQKAYSEGLAYGEEYDG